MGFKGIATTLAVLAGVLFTNTAQADNRNTVYGYFRTNYGVTLSPAMGDFQTFKLGEDGARLGNEGPWAQIGWNLQVYKGEDNVTGNVHYMITSGDIGGSASSFGHKEFYVDVSHLPGVDAEIWAGQRDWLKYAVDLLDREYWSAASWDIGAGITNLKIGEKMTFHYGLLRPNATGLKHVIQLRGIELFPGSSIDIGAAAAHTMVEESTGLNNGFSGHLRWQQNDILGGRNVVYVGAGMGAMADAKNFNGANYTLNSKAMKLLVLDDLTIKPMPELGISFVVLAQHDEHNSNGAIRNRLEFGARLNYDVSKYVALMLDGNYDMTKTHAPGVDAATLIKITPAVQLNVASGSVPRIRLYGTYASWNDAANLIAGEKSAFTAGITGEAWF